jgi:hypothetical protein
MLSLVFYISFWSYIIQAEGKTLKERIVSKFLYLIADEADLAPLCRLHQNVLLNLGDVLTPTEEEGEQLARSLRNSGIQFTPEQFPTLLKKKMAGKFLTTQAREQYSLAYRLVPRLEGEDSATWVTRAAATAENGIYINYDNVVAITLGTLVILKTNHSWQAAQEEVDSAFKMITHPKETNNAAIA